MKKTVLLVAAVFSLGFSASTQKLGHIDGQALLEAMPEMKTVDEQLRTKRAEYEEYMKGEEAKYNTMTQEYLQNAEAWPEAIRKDKEQKIAAQEQNMQQFQDTANDEMAEAQQKLLTPILEKAKMAIEDVGKTNGFVYIFDSSSGALLYKGGEDVMPLVKAKLGIQ